MIPSGKMHQLCDFGCGQISRYTLGDKQCCRNSPGKCPGPPKTKEMIWPGKLTIEELKNKKFSIFHNYYYPESTILSEFIKILGWGSNRVIRQQGFRILSISQELMPVKQWIRTNDPYFLIKESSYVSQPKGQSIVTIHIGQMP